MADWTNVAQAATWLAEGKRVEYKHSSDSWLELSPSANDLSTLVEYRLAPRTIKIGDVEVNAPILERPSNAVDAVWVWDFNDVWITSVASIEDATFRQGRVHDSCDNATAARDAIVRLLTGAE